MLSRIKNKSIVSLLCDRELNVNGKSNSWHVKIARRLINSDREDLYLNKWTKTVGGEICHENGYIYSNYYEQCCPLNAINKINKKSPQFFSVENMDTATNEVSFYSGKCVGKDIGNVCVCNSERCNCLSQSMLWISEDNWLCQSLMENGRLMKKIYLNSFSTHETFKLNMWKNYESFGIQYYSYRDYAYQDYEKANLHLTVFHYPLEFFCRIKIKRSVFGEDVEGVSLFDKFLIVSFGRYTTDFYNFDEFIKQGTLNPYRLGDNYENKGKIGSYPVGLPFNFHYDEAPPLLFKIKQLNRNISFGSYPYHYIVFSASHYWDIRLADMETNMAIEPDEPLILVHHPNFVNFISFHPDHSHRLIAETTTSIDFYKFVSQKDNRRIWRQFSFQFDEESSNGTIDRTIDRSHFHVRSFAYEPELDILAIFGKRAVPSDSTGLVKLYDNVTGENLRTIEVGGLQENGYHNFDLYMHSTAIILFEVVDNTQDDILSNVHVYMM